MNSKSGIEHIKEQLFSFEGTANRVQFFITTVITLPIFIWWIGFGIYILGGFIRSYYIHGRYIISDIDMAAFFVLAIPGSISAYMFFAMARRRLRDLNIPMSPYINCLIFWNVFVIIEFFVFMLLNDNARGDERALLQAVNAFVLFGTIFIDIIVLLIMFFIKGVSNVNQEE